MMPYWATGIFLMVKKVLVFGEALPAEVMVKLLAEIESVEILGQVTTFPSAQEFITDCKVDLLIIIDNGRTSNQDISQFLFHFPWLPIIHTNINNDKVQIITSKSIKANLNEFSTALITLVQDDNSQDLMA